MITVFQEEKRAAVQSESYNFSRCFSIVLNPLALYLPLLNYMLSFDFRSPDGEEYSTIDNEQTAVIIHDSSSAELNINLSKSSHEQVSESSLYFVLKFTIFPFAE